MLLALDTSTRYAGVALADADRVVAVRAWHSTVNHTAELMPAVAQLLENAGVKVGQLEAVAVALGPGGFSALRVGMSAAKGLALAAHLPVIGVGSLDLEAFPYITPDPTPGLDSNSGLKVCALLEAGRNEAASALFNPRGERLREDRVGPLEDLVEELSTELLLAPVEPPPGPAGPVIVCGEGVGPWAEELTAKLGPAAVVCQPLPANRVWALAALARRRLAAGEVDDPATLQPQYLRMPSIGTPKRRDGTPQRSSDRQNPGRLNPGR